MIFFFCSKIVELYKEGCFGHVCQGALYIHCMQYTFTKQYACLVATEQFSIKYQKEHHLTSVNLFPGSPSTPCRQLILPANIPMKKFTSQLYKSTFFRVAPQCVCPREMNAAVVAHKRPLPSVRTEVYTQLIGLTIDFRAVVADGAASSRITHLKLPK